MNLPPIYLDECIDYRLATALRTAEIDVLTVSEAGAASHDDEAQLSFATSQGRMLLSQNQIDFRRLHATFMRTGRPHGGIVLVPQTVPYQRLERRVRLLLDWVARFSEHQSRLFTWTALQQEIIHGFRLPEWDETIVRDTVGWRAQE
jgi:predicted nuclease of predicted toxin-antitoxin system